MEIGSMGDSLPRKNLECFYSFICQILDKYYLLHAQHLMIGPGNMVITLPLISYS